MSASGGRSERGMHFDVIVCGNEYRDRMAVVCQFAGPTKAKSRKSLGEVSDAQIGPFNVRCANQVMPWCASFDFDFDADIWGGRIAAGRV